VSEYHAEAPVALNAMSRLR